MSWHLLSSSIRLSGYALEAFEDFFGGLQDWKTSLSGVFFSELKVLS